MQYWLSSTISIYTLPEMALGDLLLHLGNDWIWSSWHWMRSEMLQKNHTCSVKPCSCQNQHLKDQYHGEYRHSTNRMVLAFPWPSLLSYDWLRHYQRHSHYLVMSFPQILLLMPSTCIALTSRMMLCDLCFELTEYALFWTSKISAAIFSQLLIQTVRIMARFNFSHLPDCCVFGPMLLESIDTIYIQVICHNNHRQEKLRLLHHFFTIPVIQRSKYINKMKCISRVGAQKNFRWRARNVNWVEQDHLVVIKSNESTDLAHNVCILRFNFPIKVGPLSFSLLLLNRHQQLNERPGTSLRSLKFRRCYLHISAVYWINGARHIVPEILRLWLVMYATETTNLVIS